MLEPVMTMNEGARVYTREGHLLGAGERVAAPGLVRTLELVADEGATTAYGGTIGRALVELCVGRGGLVTAADLSAYQAHWREPVAGTYLGRRLLTREGLSRLRETVEHLPRLASLGASQRVVALTEALAPAPAATPLGDTTNTVTVDREGNACVLTSSLGLGSGDWLPGLDLHLNSMLGEADLIRGPLEPGERMESMMSPTLVVDRAGSLVFAGGAAGGTRIRTALVSVLAGVLDEGLATQHAVSRPRFHPAGTTLNAEPGVDAEGLLELERRGWTVRRWDTRHHYFGGVSVVTEGGAAGDPRRGGAARVLG
jgi:gamma-glutamyltranspeptidase/glutathione hydrolase